MDHETGKIRWIPTDATCSVRKAGGLPPSATDGPLLRIESVVLSPRRRPFPGVKGQDCGRYTKYFFRLMEELAGEAGEVDVDVCCPECGERAQNKGKKKREIQHREGAVEVNRAYYYCPSCKQGFFPPGPETGAGETGVESADAGDGVAPSG